MIHVNSDVYPSTDAVCKLRQGDLGLRSCGQRPQSLWAEASELVGRGLRACGQRPLSL